VADRDMEQWLKNTPSRRRGDNKLFRKLHDKGVLNLKLVCCQFISQRGHHGYLMVVAFTTTCAITAYHQ